MSGARRFTATNNRPPGRAVRRPQIIGYGDFSPAFRVRAGAPFRLPATQDRQTGPPPWQAAFRLTTGLRQTRQADGPSTAGLRRPGAWQGRFWVRPSRSSLLEQARLACAAFAAVASGAAADARAGSFGGAVPSASGPACGPEAASGTGAGATAADDGTGGAAAGAGVEEPHEFVCPGEGSLWPLRSRQGLIGGGIAGRGGSGRG